MERINCFEALYYRKKVYVWCLFFLQAAKANLEKAQSELGSASDEASRAEVQISIEANEAIIKALE